MQTLSAGRVVWVWQGISMEVCMRWILACFACIGLLLGAVVDFPNMAHAMDKGEFMNKMNMLMNAQPQDPDALIDLGSEGLAKWAGDDAEYQSLAYTSMAFGYSWKGKNELAIKEIDRALKLSPPLMVFVLKAYILKGQNKIEDAFNVCMEGASYFKNSDAEGMCKNEFSLLK